MSRQGKFEDDGRVVADMSDLEGPGLFGGHFRGSWNGRKSKRESESLEDRERNPWEDVPFTWQERMRYIMMALGAALLIGLVLLGGVAVVIWLFTLYD